MTFAEWIMQPWPWWFSGILVGLTVPLMAMLSDKSFGISTSFQQIDSMCTQGRGPTYLSQYDRRAGFWTLLFVIGIGLGGFVGSQWLSATPIEFLPANQHNLAGGIRLAIGGFLIGFGAR